MDEFWKALEMVDFDQPLIELEYRLYHDDHGAPLFYTCEKPKGEYIIVSKDEYERCRYDILVRDGNICYLNDISTSSKLVPGDQGTATHPENVLLVDPDSSFYWTLKTYFIE